MPAFHPFVAHYHNALRARSVSRSVWEMLEDTSFPGQILSVHSRACTLEFPGSNLVSVVLPEIGDGPLNLVLEDSFGALPALQPGQEVRVERRRLEVGGLAILLAGARTWEPTPHWVHLRNGCETITGHLDRLEAYALSLAPEHSLLALVQADCRRDRSMSISSGPAPAFHSTSGPVTVDESINCVAFEAARRLRAGWQGDPALLKAGSKQLAGLGGGLTPAGDDFLSGVMLWTWLAHPDPQTCCRAMLEAATSRTTRFSAALLAAAAAGQCSVSWHGLLEVLERGDVQHLAAATERVLSYGHTSGADTLAGFLWMALGLSRSLTP
jgi:hypothetical protein